MIVNLKILQAVTKEVFERVPYFENYTQLEQEQFVHEVYNDFIMYSDYVLIEDYFNSEEYKKLEETLIFKLQYIVGNKEGLEINITQIIKENNL